MTKKHFEAIARALRESGASYDVVKKVADTLCDFNPRFDFYAFCRAAGQPYVHVVSFD